MVEETGRRGLSAAWLKYFAAFFMLLDHSDALFTLLSPVAAPETMAFYFLRSMGRMAFPIFVFFLAEGCRKTHDFPAYLKRLFLFALVAQLPFFLAFQALNVLFTFFLGAMSVYCYQKISAKAPALWGCLPALFFAALAHVLHTDYGYFGVLMVFLLYLCGENRRRALLLLAGGMVFEYFVCDTVELLSAFCLQNGLALRPALTAFLSYYCAQTLPYYLCNTFFACVPVVLLSFYHGDRGRGSKYFFYWFYPVHLLLLVILRMLIPV